MYFRRKVKITTGNINIIAENKELYALAFHYHKEKETHFLLRMRDDLTWMLMSSFNESI